MSDVLAIAEHRRGELRDVSFELITAGAAVAEAAGGELHVAIIGGDVEGFAEDLNREGVDVVHAAANGEEFNHDVYVQTVEALVDEVGPEYLLLPNSVNGLDYAPALAIDRNMPLVTDVVELEVDGEDLVAMREMYGSKVETAIEVAEGPYAITIRSAEWPPAEGMGDAEVRAFDFETDEDAIGTTVTGFEEAAGGDVDISEADFLVSVGRGIGEEDNLELIEALAEATGATISASRPIVDNGWLAKNRQVGQSGKTVTPDVYLAVGISGAVQHVAGMKGADTIIAINTDPNAPIFDIADYGIIGDLFEVVPELTEQLS